MQCAIYCRLSKEDEDKIQESESIQNQKNILVTYALEQGWEIYGIYCDEDYSGADKDRPGWNAMLDEAQAGRFEVVLCKNQSRFTRDLEMVEKYIHGLFPLWGIRFVALLDHVDTQVKGNKKARQINGLINEWYLEDLSENIRAVLDRKRRDGKHIGSTAAYGYRKDPGDKNRLLIDEQAAQVVRAIFRMYLGGMGTQKIAAQLTDSGVPSPSAYKNGGHGPWTRTAVSRILRGRVYTGDLVQGTKRKASYKSKRLLAVPEEQWIVVPDTHPPIIDRETFAAAGRLLGSNARSDGTGQVHLLAGKAVCRTCGSTMYRISHKYKGEQRSYLQCGAYARSRAHPPCTGHTIRLDLLEEAVAGRVRSLVSGSYDPGPLLQQSRTARQERQREQARAELAKLGQKLEQLERALQSLYLDKVDGVITQEQFSSMNKAFLEEQQCKRDALQARAQALEQAGQAAPKQEDIPSSPWPIDRELIGLLIDRIEVGERDKDTGRQEIHIHWLV